MKKHTSFNFPMGHSISWAIRLANSMLERPGAHTLGLAPRARLYTASGSESTMRHHDCGTRPQRKNESVN